MRHDLVVVIARRQYTNELLRETMGSFRIVNPRWFVPPVTSLHRARRGTVMHSIWMSSCGASSSSSGGGSSRRCAHGDQARVIVDERLLVSALVTVLLHGFCCSDCVRSPCSVPVCIVCVCEGECECEYDDSNKSVTWVVCVCIGEC